MSRIMSTSVLVIALVTLVWAGFAQAQGPRNQNTNQARRINSLDSDMTQSRNARGQVPRLRQGKLNTLKRIKIELPGGTTTTVDKIVKSSFREQGNPFLRNARVRGSSNRGLLGAEKLEEFGYETKDAVIISMQSARTVVDPAKFRNYAPNFKTPTSTRTQRRRGRRGNENPPEEVKQFMKNFEADTKRLQANHPIRQAYESGGTDAAVAAIKEGKGDSSRRLTFIIPKKRPTVVDGRVRFKGLDDHRAVRGVRKKFRSTKKINWMGNFKSTKAMAPKNKNIGLIKAVPKTATETGGEYKSPTPHEFLTGWTEHWSFAWEEEFDWGLFGGKAWAGAGYTIGIRFPAKFTTRVTPKTIRIDSTDSSGKPTQGHKFNIFVKGEVSNENEAYYKRVGLSTAKAAKGYEIPFHFWFDIGAKFWVFGYDVGSWKIDKDIDYSADLKPVFGNDQILKYKLQGTDKWKDAVLWIPPKITYTDFSGCLGKVCAFANISIGIEFGGSGKAKALIEPMADGKVINGAKKKITLNSKDAEKKVVATIPKLKGYGSVSYGYRISEPEYHWTLKIRPAVKADIGGSCKYWICFDWSDKWTLGPYYPLGWISLFDTKFTHHSGTNKEDTITAGSLTYAAIDNTQMHVCLKTHNGRYLRANPHKIEEIDAKGTKCGSAETFIVTNVSGGNIAHDRTILLRTAYKVKNSKTKKWSHRYVRVANENLVLGDQWKPNNATHFKLSIQGSNKAGKSLSAGKSIQLKAANGKWLAAKSGGGGDLITRNGGTVGHLRFKVVESEFKSVTWKCPEGNRSGFSNCKVQTISGLKSMLGDLCGRTSDKCPCYIKESSKKGDGVLYCAKKTPWNSTKKTCQSPQGQFVKQERRKSGLKIHSWNICKHTAFKGPYGKKLLGISKCKPHLVIKNGTLHYKQNFGGCPYWISSKYDMITRRADAE